MAPNEKPPERVALAAASDCHPWRDASEDIPLHQNVQDGDRDILLAMMRAAVARHRSIAFDIEEIAVTLKAASISPAGAVYWLRANGVADLVLRETRT